MANCGCRCGVEHGPADPGQSGRGQAAGSRAELEHVYKYRDEAGTVLFEVLRFKNPRGFRQRQPGQKPPWNLEGVRKVLYNLPAVVTADPGQPVWVVEGEKDVDRLGSLGLLATCNPGGAGKWLDEFSQSLAGRHCRIIADNDKWAASTPARWPGRLPARPPASRSSTCPGCPTRAM